MSLLAHRFRKIGVDVNSRAQVLLQLLTAMRYDVALFLEHSFDVRFWLKGFLDERILQVLLLVSLFVRKGLALGSV